MSTAAALLVVALALAPASGDPAEVVIEIDRLAPAVLQTTTASRVTFVNRSGRVVHVEFYGGGDQHHIIQNPREIWAVFHRPGPHRYIVHVEGRPDLVGTVNAESWLTVPAPEPICQTLTVEGVCLEP